MSMAAEIGSGVSNVGMGCPLSGSGRCPGREQGGGDEAVSADPAGVALTESPAFALTRAAALGAGVEGGGHGADEPGVDRQPCAVRRLVDTRLELFGEAQ